MQQSDVSRSQGDPVITFGYDAHQPSKYLKHAEPATDRKIGTFGEGYGKLQTARAPIPHNGHRSSAEAPALPIDIVEMTSRNTRCMYFRCKRVIDVILASSLLVVLFPLMLLIAVLIKLESPGPVLFVQ